MADRRGNKRKTSKFSRSPVAQKALFTSTGSKRFQAYDDDQTPEDPDAIIKSEIGAGGIEDSLEDYLLRTQREVGGRAHGTGREGTTVGETDFDIQEALDSEQKYKQTLLMQGIPPELEDEAIRKFREKQRSEQARNRERQVRAVRRQQASGTLSDYAERPESYTPYVQDDPPQMGEARRKLHGQINRAAGNRYLERGGRTILNQSRDRSVLPVDEQLILAEEDRELGLDPTASLTREQAENAFPIENVTLSPQDREKAERLLEKRNQLRLLERDIKARRQARRGEAGPLAVKSEDEEALPGVPVEPSPRPRPPIRERSVPQRESLFDTVQGNKQASAADMLNKSQLELARGLRYKRAAAKATSPQQRQILLEQSDIALHNSEDLKARSRTTRVSSQVEYPTEPIKPYTHPTLRRARPTREQLEKQVKAASEAGTSGLAKQGARVGYTTPAPGEPKTRGQVPPQNILGGTTQRGVVVSPAQSTSGAPVPEVPPSTAEQLTLFDSHKNTQGVRLQDVAPGQMSLWDELHTAQPKKYSKRARQRAGNGFPRPRVPAPTTKVTQKELDERRRLRGATPGPGQMQFDRLAPPRPLQTLQEQVKQEREAVEKELHGIRGATPEGVTPQETARQALDALKEAINIPAPLGQIIPGERPGRLPRTKAAGRKAPEVTREEASAYVRAVVDSHHAATHQQRTQAAERARKLADQITQKQSDEYSRLDELRQMNEVRDEMSTYQAPLEAYTAEGRVKRSVDPTGATPMDRLRDREREGEARARGEEPPLKPPVGRKEWQRAWDSPRTPWQGSKAGMGGPPPGSGPIPGPHRDPRLNDLTVEDVYRAYGHETTAPRYKWEKERLKSRFTGEEFTKPKPPAFSGIKQQGKFMRDQARNRANAVLHGTDLMGFDEHGRVIRLPGKGLRTEIGTSPNARVGFSPNIMYEYKIRNPRADSESALSRQNALNDLVNRREMLFHNIETTASDRDREKYQKDLKSLQRRIREQQKRVDELRAPTTRLLYPTDLKTKFTVGNRNRFGQFYPDEYDEMVAPATIIQQQEERFKFRQGVRDLKGPEAPRPEGVSEVRYVPTIGATGLGTHLTMHDPEGRQQTVYEVRDTMGQWQAVTRPEFDRAREDRAGWEDRRVGTAPPLARERSVPRIVQYRYVAPSDVEMKTSARDIGTIRIPKIGPFEERLGIVQFDDDTTKLWNKYIGQPVRMQHETEKLLAAKKISEDVEARIAADPNKRWDPATQTFKTPITAEEKALLKKHGIKSHEEAKILAKAAGAAGFYSQREKFYKQRGPQVLNKVMGGKFGGYQFPVDYTIVRPNIEKVHNLPWQLQHPLRSATTSAGPEVSTIKYRQELIKPDVFTRRYLERELSQLEKIQSTKEFVEKHRGDKGPVGAYTRWQMRGLARSPDYKAPMVGDPTDRLGLAMKHAEQVATEKQLTFWRNKANSEFTWGDVDTPNAISEATRQRAGEVMLKYHDIEDKERLRAARGPWEYHKPAGFVSRGIHGAGMERNILIGGAAVGTAAGAAYLYHRHQQSKKPEAERVALYNRVLPPAFHGPPVPHLRVTSTVKFGDTTWMKEMGLAGKELPTQVGASLQRKRIALRPMDRGYDPSLKLVGRPSFKGTPGGSRKKGLVYYGTDPVGRRSNIKRSSHEVTVRGHKLPGKLNISDLKKVNLSSRNPNAMSSSEMDDIIWAHENTPLENQVKNFYRGQGGRRAADLLDRWEDPDEIERIRRQKQRESREYRTAARRALTGQTSLRSAAR